MDQRTPPLSVVVWKWQRSPRNKGYLHLFRRLLWKRPPSPRNSGRDYGAEHVNIMRNMLERHLQLPHRLFCVTDDPTGLDPRVVYVPMWTEHAAVFKNCRRLKILDESVREIFGDRILQLDLDLVIVDDLTDVASAPDDLVYGGSMHLLLIRTGHLHDLWERFSRDPEKVLAEAHAAGQDVRTSDQAILNHHLKSRGIPRKSPGPIRINFRDLPSSGVPSGVKLVHFIGSDNPAMHRDHPLVKEHWR